MACGTPVINTQIDSGVPFVSLHEVSGLTVPPSNPVALSGALNLLLEDDRLRHRLSVGARDRVREHFTLEKMANDTLALYEQVLRTSAVKTNTAATFAAAVL
jgi:rhamnosyl/mannosyltransferase